MAANRQLAKKCAVKGAGLQRVQLPPGNWFAPPGSNQSGDRGNEVVGASGVESRVGDLASMQAVTRVNAEQAPKRATQEPILPQLEKAEAEGTARAKRVPSDLPG